MVKFTRIFFITLILHEMWYRGAKSPCLQERRRNLDSESYAPYRTGVRIRIAKRLFKQRAL